MIGLKLTGIQLCMTLFGKLGVGWAPCLSTQLNLKTLKLTSLSGKGLQTIFDIKFNKNESNYSK
ncbi:hypothetical protein Mic7113_0388 [Allocoleopsis franciscana PCC 7113]|uniref:Uncharacterized protein n=1 Tax=Allocoleopsis franciscana PCC 7113 TaxID=1173027 RepID=K9W969_9CYAN|nr:hypothetical protein Mic7113_0388 [Allocoleopsis franciscana PCC 7113]